MFIKTADWLVPGEPTAALPATSALGSRVAVVAACIFAVASLIWFSRWTVDDAYIAFRYAENLADHGQLTWNVGEDPVEGYTGIALPVLLAAGVRLGVPAGVASRCW